MAVSHPRHPSAAIPASVLAFAATFLGLPGVLSAQASEYALTDARLFDPQHVVEVKVELPAEDWHELRTQTREMVAALGKTAMERPFDYFKGDVVVDGVRIEDVGIRKKGFIGSLSSTRPSLKIKFDEFVKQAPVRGLDRLTLNNNNQDRTVASQFLSYRIFDDVGIGAPRCNLAQVWVNGESLGIYSHVESIRAPFLERAFGDSSGDLYEGTVADFFVGGLDRIELKTKRTERRHLQQLASILAADELDGLALRRVLDVEQFVKYWATESVIGFWDGYTNNQNNYFVYRGPADGKLRFIPWGPDACFTDRMPLPPYRIEPKSVHSQALLTHALYGDDQARDLYRKTVDQLLAEHWDEERLNRDLDLIADLVDGRLHEDQDGFRRGVSRMRNFIDNRREVLTDELQDWPFEFPEAPRKPTYFKEIGTVEVSFAANWREGSPEEPLEVGEADIELTLNGEPVVLSRVGVSSQASRWPSRGGQPRNANVVFTCERKSDGQNMTITASLPMDEFKPSGERPSAVQGMFREGRGGRRGRGGWGGWKMISGTALLDEAATEPGASVRGSMQLKLVQMVRGGNPRGR